jgi:hypothetical protein
MHSYPQIFAGFPVPISAGSNTLQIYRSADKSLARPGRKQANVSVRMAWISFGPLPWWQLMSRCCWNRARPWHASELVSLLVGLRTYQHPGNCVLRLGRDSSVGIANRYGLDGPGIESPWGARILAPFQTGPGAQPASYKSSTGSLSRAWIWPFSRIKRRC